MSGRLRRVIPVVLALTLLPFTAVADHAPSDARAFLMGGATEGRGDADRDGVTDHFAIGVPVRVSEKGTYQVNVTLSWPHHTSRVFYANATLDPGDHFVTVRIPSGYMWNTGHSGKYEVDAVLVNGVHEGAAVLDRYAYTTANYPRDAWPVATAGFSAAPVFNLLDQDGDGHPDALQIDVPLNVTRAGAYRVHACPSARGASADLACLPPAVVQLTSPGARAAFTLPADALPLDSPSFGVDVHLELEALDPLTPLDSGDGASPRYRSATFTQGTGATRNATAAPVVDGDVRAGGLAFTVDVPAEAAGRRDLRVTVLAPATGATTSGTATLPAEAASDNRSVIRAEVVLPGAEVARVLDTTHPPVLYWTLADAFGVVVNGGAIELFARPTAAIVVEAGEGVLAGDPVTLKDASRIVKGAITARAWTIDGKDAGAAEAFTHAFPWAGPRDVELTVKNAYGIAASTSRVVQVGMNIPPQVDVATAWVLREGEKNTLAFESDDPEGRPVTWRVASGPEGVRVADARLEWTPTYEQGGSHTITLHITDGHNELTRELRVLVHERTDPNAGGGAVPGVRFVDATDAPVPGEAVATTGVAFTLTVQAMDAADAALPVTLENPPEGATFLNGTFSWPSPVEGVHSLRFASGDATHIVVLTVASADAAPPDAAESDGSPLPSISFVTPAVTAGLAVAAGLVMERRRRRA